MKSNKQISSNSEHTKLHLSERWKNWNPICKVCGKRAVAKLLCNKHYLREWRGGYSYV